MLVLRALKLGDLLVAVPALRALREYFPEHRIMLAAPAWLEPLISLIGADIELLPTPSLDAPIQAPGAIDIAVNLHGKGPQSHERLDELNPRARIGHRSEGWEGPEWVQDMHERDRWVSMLAHYGIPGDSTNLRLAVPAIDIARFTGGAEYCVVHAGAAYGSRHWPADRFAAVVDHLVDSGKTVLLTGSDSERTRAEDVMALVSSESGDAVRVAAGSTTLLEYAAIIARAAIVISADTGAAHLASAFARPSVTLFGPASPEQWGPPPGPHRVLTVAHLRRGTLFTGVPDPALTGVNVDDVLDSIDGLLT